MKVLVTGAASGLGHAIVDSLMQELDSIEGVVPFDREYDPIMDVASFTTGQAIEMWGCGFECDALINCAGINQNEWFEDVEYNSFMRVQNVNTWGQINMTQAMLPFLKRSNHKVVINIVSNAAHMPMTSSLAYNVSKAGALMATKQMAHELTPKYGITVFSVSPNKLRGTGMSDQIDTQVQIIRGWSKEYATEYQKKGLMHGLETPPEAVAEFITGLLVTGQYKFMSGTDVPFGK